MSLSPAPRPIPRTVRLLGDFVAALVFVFVVALLGGLVSSLVGCPNDVARRASTVAVVGAGSTVRALRDENERVYAAAADRARDTAPSLAAYHAAMVPLTTAFDARTEALASASNALFAGAALIDASAGGDAGFADYARAALSAAEALRAALGVLTASGALPPLAIPAAVRTTLTTLEQLAGPSFAPAISRTP